jgi:hypothetical protein
MSVNIISQTARFSGKRYRTWNVCFDFLFTFVWNISHSENNSARYCHKCSYVFMWSTRCSCQVLRKLEFSTQFFGKNIIQCQNLMKIRAVGAQFLNVDGRTYTMKVIFAFPNSAKAPKSTTNRRFGIPLLLFFHARPVIRPAITSAARYHKNVGGPTLLGNDRHYTPTHKASHLRRTISPVAPPSGPQVSQIIIRVFHCN